MKNFTKERRELVEAGWRRQDRANEERWAPPWNGIGFLPPLVSYRTARKRYLKGLDAAIENIKKYPKPEAR